MNKHNPVGDGVSDDTEAIQALLDGGRSTVHLPPPSAEQPTDRKKVLQKWLVERTASPGNLEFHIKPMEIFPQHEPL